MFSLIYDYMHKKIGGKEENRRRKEFEDKSKLAELVAQLRRDDSPERERAIGTVTARQAVNWNCKKKEGVITSLSETGGVINEKHHFLKIAAKGDWNKLKVGSKLTFLLFEGFVKHMELLEDGWDAEAEEIAIPENEDVAGYNTDIRTVKGTVVKVQDEILTVDTGGYSDQFIALEDHPELKWNFIHGDNVTLECVMQEEDWIPFTGMYGTILHVNSIRPNREKHETGTVTSVESGYAILDDSIMVNESVSGKKLKVCDEYEFEAIETSFLLNGRTFGWRVTNLIKKIEKPADRKLNNHSAVQMHDATFTLRHMSKEIRQSISIYNTSSEPVTLNTCHITSNSGLVTCDRNEINSHIQKDTGRFNIHLKIFPKEIGSFMEELTADFGSFKKKCLVTIQVHDDQFSKGNKPRRSKDDTELIPGQKVRQAPRFIEIRIRDYPVPEELKMMDHKKQAQLVARDMVDAYPFLFEELRRDNYVNKMRCCLYLEEIAMKIHFERYKIERGHFENKGDFLRLEVHGVAEKRPSVSIGDSIRVTDPFTTKEKKFVYEGCIHKVEQNGVLVKFDRNFHGSHNYRDFHIEFFFSRTCFRRQQYALDKAVALGGLGYDFLLPTITKANKYPQIDASLSPSNTLSINDRHFEFFNEKLNKYQKEAVINVLRAESRPLPYIIYGPPGTGKTATVTECIEQIVHKIPTSRIIVAAPSNSAANIIVDRLIASGRYKGGDFVRIVSFNQIERGAIPDHIKKYCVTIDIGYDDGNASNLKSTDSGLRLNCSKSVIMQYRIFISTLSSLGSLMHIKFMPDHFTHVIIDEAGQTVETESLIPMTFVSRNNGQVILAGDPKQLGPIIISQVAKMSGYDKSYLERLSEHVYYQAIYGPKDNEFDRRFVTKLKTNYRAVPSILGIYNKLFYRGELEAAISDEKSDERRILDSIDSILWNRENVDPRCGVYFVNVSKGRNMRKPESSSWFNNEEASRIFLFVCKLKQCGISMKDIGIITPYTLQVKTIRRIIEDTMPECGLKVGTVEEFQGQERQIILVSTVRASDQFLASDEQFNLGFLKCPKRMNVAISRARALLVIFGKESILASDDNWRTLIQYTKEKGSYTSV